MRLKKKQYIKGEVKAPQTGDVFSGIASSGRRDRDGDTIDQGGWLIDDYKKNPVLLWGHNPFMPPIGKTMNIRQDGGFLKFDFTFASTPMAQELKSLVEEGFLNTFSVGFIPKDFGDESAGEATFTESELLEISLVSIPSNPDAMVTSRSFQDCSEATKQYIMGEIQRAKMIVNHESRSFPSSNAAWDEEAERRAAGIDDLKVMATYIDEKSPNDKVSYKLLHHTRSAEYPLSKDGLDEAVKNIDQLPEDMRDAAYAHLKEHYTELGLEAPSRKGKEPEQEEPEAEAKMVELADEDRKLLKRVADVLEKVANGQIDTSLEAKTKVARKGRGEDANAFRQRVMTRALQIVAKTASKRLAEMKRNV